MPPEAPAHAPSSPRAGRLRRVLASLALPLKLAYAAGTAALSVWVASFAPGEGPPLEPYFPPSTVWAARVRDGVELLRAAYEHPAVQEVLADPDFNELALPRLFPDARADATRVDAAARAELEQRYKNVHPALKWLVPATPAGVAPFMGGECAVLRTAPAQAGLKPGWLIFTRLSGARGQLARLGAWFKSPKGKARVFDLGGGLMAIGMQGAEPGAPQAPAMPQESSPLAADARPLAFVSIFPRQMESIRPAEREQEITGSPQYEVLSEALREFAKTDRFIDAVLQALVKPPAAASIFQAGSIPAAIHAAIAAAPGGRLVANGRVEEGVPPLPSAIQTRAGGGMAAEETLLAEGLLPFDARAAFLNYLMGSMRIRKTAPALTKDQRRWLLRLEDLRDRNVNLDRDLFPAFGKSLQFSLEPAPPDVTASVFGLLRVNIPFNGAHPGARYASAELARERWDFLFDGKPTEKPPYVLRVRKEGREGFVLALSQITPAWVISNTTLAVLSDGGPFARIEPPRIFALVDAPRASTLAPQAGYYLRLDGPRLAPSVEAWATLLFDGMEENMGAKEFMERFPDAPRLVKLSRKLAGLIGKFHFEMAPLAAGGSATLRLSWLPGSLSATEEKKKDDDSAPPPPPAD